jgi:amino acid transporter
LQATASSGSNRLHRRLSSWGVLLLTLSVLSPIFSIYSAGTDVLAHAGTGAPALFVVGIGAAVVWAAVYAELGSAYPYAGGDYVGVGATMGSWAGFASLGQWLVLTPPLAALLARTMAEYAQALIPSLSISLAAVGCVTAATGIALFGVRTNAVITGLFLAIEALAVLTLCSGLLHPVQPLAILAAWPVALDPHAHWISVSATALAAGAVSAAFATVGGNQAIAFGEELLEPQRNMGRVILWAALIGAFATALPIAGVVLGSADLNAVLASPTPFTTFMIAAAGPLAGRALSAAAVAAIFNALVAQVMFGARLFYSFGRDTVFAGLINRMLAHVHGSSGAPRTATLFLGALSLLFCMLDAHTLLVFVSGLVVYTLALVSSAVLIGRRRQLTGQAGYWRSLWYPLAPVLGLMLAAAFAIAEFLDANTGRPGLLLLSLILLAAVLWYVFVLRRRPGGWSPRVEFQPSLATRSSRPEVDD